MIWTLGLVVLFLVTTFFAMLNNILVWYELIPFACLAFAPYLYCRNKKIFNVYILIGTVMSGLRFYMNYLLFKTHGEMIYLPITFNQPIIKQFTGMTVIITLYIWYMYIFYTCFATIKDNVSKSEDYDSLVRNNKITRFINLFSVTTVLVFIYIVSTIWIYDFVNLTKFLLIFVCTVVVIAICFFTLITDVVRSKKEEFVLAMRDADRVRAQVKIYDLDELVEDEEAKEQEQEEVDKSELED